MDHLIKGLHTTPLAAGLKAGTWRAWGDLLPKVTSYALVLGLAYLLAGFAWALIGALVPSADRLQTPLGAGMGAPEARAVPAAGAVAWKEFALFGDEPEPGAAPVQPKPQPQQRPVAPAEPVRLKLFGTIASSDPDKSLAVLSVKDAKADIYRVGAELQAGVILKEVRGWSIVVTAGSEDQVIWMIEDSERKPSPSIPAPLSRSGGEETPSGFAEEYKISDAKLVEKLEGYRAELTSNPIALVDRIRASVVQRDGQPYGMRLRPGTDRALLNQLGLRPGDVLVAVNGVQVNDMANLPDVLDQLKTQQEFVLDIERGGNRQELRVVMDQTGAN